MHVLVLCEYGTVNGGERSLLAALAHRPPDLSVSVLAPAKGRLADALDALGVEHVPFAIHDPTRQRRPTEEILDKLLMMLERLAPDCVHANSLSMGRITGVLSSLCRVPCTAHLRDIVRLSNQAVRDLGGNARLIAVSHATRDFHVAQGLSAGRIAVLYNGIDCELWQPRTRTGQLHRELGLPEDAVIAMAIGQIGMRKGLDTLIHAAISTSRSFPQIHYAIIGERYSDKAESLAFEESLHLRLEESGIAERFHWLGYRQDVDHLLNEADVLIHPARQEPFGRVLLEAGACARPIIATRVGGTAEMLTDGQSALLIEPGESDALAKAIQRLVSEPELRLFLGEAARRRVVQQFDIRDRARDLYNLWRKVCR